MTTDTQSETPLVERLRCQHEIVPGRPEHGVRSFAGQTVPTVLPTPIMLEAADALTAQAQEIAELREKVERLSLAAIKARQALAHAAQLGPVYDTAYGELDRAIEGAKVTHTLPMAAQQPAK